MGSEGSYPSNHKFRVLNVAYALRVWSSNNINLNGYLLAFLTYFHIIRKFILRILKNFNTSVVENIWKYWIISVVYILYKMNSIFLHYFSHSLPTISSHAYKLSRLEVVRFLIIFSRTSSDVRWDDFGLCVTQPRYVNSFINRYMCSRKINNFNTSHNFLPTMRFFYVN